MPWLNALADVARRTGYPVTEVAGWKSRGHGPQPEVRGVVCHHTAGAATGDYPSLRRVRDGGPDLEGPLSHFGLGRSGRIFVIAAGRCWHNAPSTSPAHDNSSAIGIEAENTGLGQAWPAAQIDAYERLCAELCRAFRLPASAVKAHREVYRDKPDPRGIDMTKFRAAVERLIEGDDDMPLTEKDVAEIWDRPMRGLRADDGETHPAHYLLRLAEKNATEARRSVDTEVTALAAQVTALRNDQAIQATTTVEGLASLHAKLDKLLAREGG